MRRQSATVLYGRLSSDSLYSYPWNPGRSSSLFSVPCDYFPHGKPRTIAAMNPYLTLQRIGAISLQPAASRHRFAFVAAFPCEFKSLSSRVHSWDAIQFTLHEAELKRPTSIFSDFKVGGDFHVVVIRIPHFHPCDTPLPKIKIDWHGHTFSAVALLIFLPRAARARLIAADFLAVRAMERNFRRLFERMIEVDGEFFEKQVVCMPWSRLKHFPCIALVVFRARYLCEWDTGFRVVEMPEERGNCSKVRGSNSC